MVRGVGVVLASIALLGGCAQPPASDAPADGVATAGRGVAPAATGDPSWRRARARAGDMAALSAYADRSSAFPGDSVGLHVSTSAHTFRIVAYRMGDYAAAQGTRVWSSPPLTGRSQTAMAYDAATRTPSAAWTESTRVDTSGWQPGMYLLRLVADNRAEWLVPLILRDRDVTGKVMLVIPDTTSQAYNTWGGRSAYAGPGGFADRSRAVSFARPYVEGYGTGRYFGLAHPVVVLAEETTVPVTYVAASDLDREPAVMAAAEGVVMLGHDEYWTVDRYRGTRNARDAGVDLAFLGANTMYWRTRLRVGPQGMPEVVIYKDASEDPVDGRRATARFRDEPSPSPERTLVGMDYECFPATGTFVVVDPDFFLFRGTPVTAGQRLAGIVDIEVDRAYPLPGTPVNVQIVAENPCDCGGQRSVSTSTYYSTPSGSGVFATGSIGWVARAMRTFAAGDPRRSPPLSRRFVRAATRSLLLEMAAGKMGERHPSLANIDSFDLPLVNTTGKA